MKTMLSWCGMLALAGQLLPVARAQTTPLAAPRNPTPAQAKAIRARTAARRAEAYQGPKVVPDSKKLGQKMLQKSKPADAVRIRVRELPK